MTNLEKQILQQAIDQLETSSRKYGYERGHTYFAWSDTLTAYETKCNRCGKDIKIHTRCREYQCSGFISGFPGKGINNDAAIHNWAGKTSC